MVEPLVSKAMRITVGAHAGAEDKAGQPYLNHALRVAQIVSRAGGSVAQVCAALLHDVVEDTDWTLDGLAEAGMPEEVLGLVAALTHVDGQSNDDYYAQILRAPGALLIKAADIQDNTDPERLALLDEFTAARLEKKYAHARDVLGLSG